MSSSECASDNIIRVPKTLSYIMTDISNNVVFIEWLVVLSNYLQNLSELIVIFIKQLMNITCLE